MPNSITESIRTEAPERGPLARDAERGMTARAPQPAFRPIASDSPAELRSPAESSNRRRDVGAPRRSSAVIELTVRNHPGTMSHITGLFARRAFNLEAIACAPVGDGNTSRMLLLVGNDARLEQVERQLEKLYDVLSVRHREDIEPDFFSRLVAI